MSLRSPEPGFVVAGKYRLAERLGGGGMGDVFRAENTLAGRPVALKLLRPDLADDKDLTRRFFQEAQAVNRIRHPNIVDVIDAGFAEAGPYIAMECLEGESTAAALSRDRKLTVEATVAIGIAVLGALDAAHRAGIIHRDLKPENVYLHRPEPGAPVVVKLLDFGIAKVLEPIGPTPRTRTGVVFGTPDYLSPEQATGELVLDGRSDLFAVGVLLFELLTGQRPFRAASAVATAYKVVHGAAPALAESGGPDNAALDAIVMRAMRKRPEERYATALEFARELESVVPDPAARAAALDRLEARVPPRGLVPEGAVAAAPLGPTSVSLDAGSPPRGRQARVSPGPLRGSPPVGSGAVKAGPPSLSSSQRSLDALRGPGESAMRAVGQSGRYHLRGSVLRAVDKLVTQRAGAEARDKIVSRLAKPYLDDFLHNSLTGLVFYDMEAFDAYSLATNELVLGSDVTRWRELGRASVDGELANLVKPIFKSPDVATLVRRAAGLFSRLFDYGVWTVQSEGDGVVVVRVAEVSPATLPLRHWLIGLIEQTLRSAGFTNAVVGVTAGDATRTPDLELEVIAGARR